MKKFLAEYLRQSDQDPDPAHRAAHDELFNSSWKSQEKEITTAIAADPAGSQGASLGNLQALPNAGAPFKPRNPRPRPKSFRAFRLHAQTFPQHARRPPHPRSGPIIPAAPRRWPRPQRRLRPPLRRIIPRTTPLRPLQIRHPLQSQRPPLDRLGRQHPLPPRPKHPCCRWPRRRLIGNHADLYFSLIERQTNISEQIAPPKYPFAIDTKAARRGALYYQVSCMGCHEGEQNDTRLYTLTELGTDPLRPAFHPTHRRPVQ